MAVTYWTGSGNGTTWTADDNWSGLHPGAGDIAVIADTSSAIAGVDESATTLTALRVGSQFTGTIGTSGTNLQVNATTVDFAGRGGGCFLHGTLPTVNVNDGIKNDDMLQLKGDVGTLRILGGQGTVTLNASSTTLDDLEIIGAPSITVSVPTGVTSLDTVTMDSGEVTIGATGATTVEVFGGQLTYTDSATITTLEIHTDATCRYNSTGTITTLTVFGGAFDMRDSTASALTITNATMHEGGMINARNGLRSVTWTNGIVFHGGMLYPARGRTLTIS